MTNPSPVRQSINAVWQLTLALGILSIVIGVVILAWPGPSLLVAGVAFGVYLLTSGFFQVVTALFGEEHHRVFGVVSGALSIVLGCLCLRSAAETVLLMAIWIGIGWLFRGIYTASTAIGQPALPQRPWVVFTGVVSAIAGIVLLVSPFSSIWILMLVAGIWALVLGVGEIGTAFQVRKAAHGVR